MRCIWTAPELSIVDRLFGRKHWYRRKRRFKVSTSLSSRTGFAIVVISAQVRDFARGIEYGRFGPAPMHDL